jgi:hypothetical protein
MVVVNPDAWTWYESPRFTLRTAIKAMEPLTFFTTAMQQLHQRFHLVLAGTKADPTNNQSSVAVAPERY